MGAKQIALNPRKGKHVYLESANKSFRTIVPREELKIDLVARAVIRQNRP
jgi:hypothetical protein